MDPIICVVGPTASGKTALAIELAKAFNGEIVSCDSMQIYRRMDIGTAKPTAEERQGIPHHMIDVADPEESFSVSRYCQMATPIVEDILRRGKTCIIAGGTGLYVDALIRGNDFAPIPSTGCRQRLERRAEAEGIQVLTQELSAVDPESVQRAQGNPRRIIRALEVYLETGQPLTAHNLATQAIPPRFSPLWIGLDDEDRQDLYRRIDLRVDLMLEQGLLEEIRSLLDSGIPESATAMQAIGYKEFIDALRGRIPMEQAVSDLKQATRRYAKRQKTWFRRNRDIHWILRHPGQTSQEIFSQARLLAQSFDN